MATETRGDRRVREITDAAARLFVERGYEETSVQDVAAAVGVLKGSLYYYIDTKEDLLFWVLRRNHESLRAHVVVEQRYDELEPLDRIRTFVARHLEFVLDHPGMSALYVQKFALLAATPQRQQEILGLRRAYEHVLVGLIADAQAAGAALPGPDPRLTARALLAMGNAAPTWYRTGGRFGKAEIVGHHADLALRAIT
jgi:AcrR family transcriptional regulator